jgi:hypothetical protein
MKIELPSFNPNADELDWVHSENDTSLFIQTLWNCAGQKRSESGFISLLVRCGWLNASKDWESTRNWRNRNIADYLQVDYESNDQLARELSRAFPRLKEPAALLRMNTGITHYYRPLRPATLEFVAGHAKQIARIFSQVFSTRNKADMNIRQAVDRIINLGYIQTLGRNVSPLNGLTPTLACLDPTRTFPIMNNKTNRLLGVIGKERDADGAVALYHLIGHYGIKDSFDLDVYAATADFKHIKRQGRSTSASSKSRKAEFRDVGLKSEIDSLARIAASRKRIRKLHNALTNRLRDYVMWRYTLQESKFDALIPDWKPGRKLLIEAKTASAGSGGRTQVRQAIGQLFDYRYKFFESEKEQVDLAVLLPSEPSLDIRALLQSLDIEVIWFSGNKIEGSIEL